MSSINTYQDWNTIIFKKKEKGKDKPVFNKIEIESSINDRLESGNKPILNCIGKERGKEIEKFRLDNKMTREMFAKKLSIPIDAYVKIEKGTSLKSDSAYNKVCVHMNKENRRNLITPKQSYT